MKEVLNKTAKARPFIQFYKKVKIIINHDFIEQSIYVHILENSIVSFD